MCFADSDELHTPEGDGKDLHCTSCGDTNPGRFPSWWCVACPARKKRSLETRISDLELRLSRLEERVGG